jgi:hypothetical protein
MVRDVVSNAKNAVEGTASGAGALLAKQVQEHGPAFLEALKRVAGTLVPNAEAAVPPTTVSKDPQPSVPSTDRDRTQPSLAISGVVAEGPPLTASTIVAVNEAAKTTPQQWRHYIAYENTIKVGGSLSWRANNPGSLRDSSGKIASVPGAVGKFAVFATLADGQIAQKNLYLLVRREELSTR